MKDIKIIHATDYDIIKVNEFLTKLIIDEKKYDSNINEECVVTGLYENFIKNDNNCILTAKNANDETMGYLFGFVDFRGDAYINGIAKLEAMFVEEKYRGKGIGVKLIDEFKIWTKSKKCRYIELSVCNDNFGAIELYKKEGFKNKKTIMSLDLEEEQ